MTCEHEAPYGSLAPCGNGVVCSIKSHTFCDKCVTQVPWNHSHGSRKRCIGCLRSQVSFRKRANDYGVLLRKMTSKDEASHASSPPCSQRDTFIPKLYLRLLWFFRRTAALFRQIRTFPQLFVLNVTLDSTWRLTQESYRDTSSHVPHGTGSLRLVGSFKLYVSFAECNLFYRLFCKGDL